jgi:hypothetical protein
MSANLAQQQCDQFNAAYGIGTRVRVRRDDKQIMHTRTRSSAYVMSSGDAVIFLDHIRGCYLLARVEPVEVSA